MSNDDVKKEADKKQKAEQIAGPELKTFTKRVAGRRGNNGEEAEFITLDLVADRMGQIQGLKRSGRTGAVWVGRTDNDGVFIPTEFRMDCEIIDGKPKIPKWAHIPDEDEAKVIEQRRLQAHFDAGNARAIDPANRRKLQ